MRHMHRVVADEDGLSRSSLEVRSELALHRVNSIRTKPHLSLLESVAWQEVMLRVTRR